MEKINRLRRQIHVHSVLYYHMNISLVSDYVFDRWSKELVELQTATPESKTEGYMPEVFADWTGETGMHLPVNDNVLRLAEWLIENWNEED